MKRTLIGVLLMLIAICGIIFWETTGREKLMFSDILVLNRAVQPHTGITEAMLSKRSVYMPPGEVLGISEASSIIGMTSKQYIPAGAELFGEYFSEPGLVVDKKADELIFSLETAKLASFPRSIKKGDRIHIYFRDKYVLDTVVIRTMDGTVETDENSGAYAENGNMQLETIEIKVNEKELEILSKLLSEDDGISVAYN